MDYKREYLRNQVKNKFYGHSKLKAKAAPNYPIGVEREYIKLTNAYMSMYKKILVKYMAQLKKAMLMDRQLQKALRTDSNDEVNKLIDELFKRMRNELDDKSKEFKLRRRLETLAHLTRKLTIKEWKKVVKSTLGINIMDDYYMGEFYQSMMKVWVDENVSLIVTIPQESLGNMQEIVKEGFSSGKTITDITKEVQSRYGINKRHARLIARDQLGKLYGMMAEKQQRDAGCIEYTWSTSKDSRVRDSHKHLEGKTCRWDDPPVVDDRTGRRAHPSMDYQCRCIALPIFNLESIQLPIQKENERS